jgi:hypothetical protein
MGSNLTAAGVEPSYAAGSGRNAQKAESLRSRRADKRKPLGLSVLKA